MTFHPEEIVDRRFSTAWRGYSKHEVDSFLAAVAADHAKLLDEYSLREQVSALHPPAEVLVAIARLAERATRWAPNIDLGPPGAPLLEAAIRGIGREL